LWGAGATRSTPKMGAGTNVQRRLVALHHVDVTWKPSDIEQREGRIIRQGNALLDEYGHDRFEVEVLAPRSPCRNGGGTTFFPWARAPRKKSARGTSARPFLARQESLTDAILRCAPALRVRRRSPAACRSPSRPRWSRARTAREKRHADHQRQERRRHRAGP
jgi:hypothetical protein